MDNLKAMETFAAVVRARSYSSAAETLGVSRAVVTKHVMQLEKHLGVRLLNRTTRRVSPTDVGRDYYDFCTGILTEIRAKEAAISSSQSEAEGTIKLIAPKSFGGLYLGKVAADFTRRHPAIHISMFLTDLSLRSFDIVEHGFDLAIRLTAQADSSLVARGIGTARWVLCAAPSYLEVHGEPETPRDLMSRACVLHTRSPATPTEANWTFTDGSNQHGVTVKVSGPVTANSVMAARAAALEGAGLALLPTYAIGPDLAAGRLSAVMKDWQAAEEQISVIFPHRSLLPHRARLFIEFLARAFQNPPWERGVQQDTLQNRSKKTGGSKPSPDRMPTTAYSTN